MVMHCPCKAMHHHGYRISVELGKMFSRLLNRCGAALCLAVLVSGCSSGGSSSTLGKLFNECTWSRSDCMYEGQYESGEEDYAEDEAARLNEAQLDRLRSSSGD